MRPRSRGPACADRPEVSLRKKAPGAGIHIHAGGAARGRAPRHSGPRRWAEAAPVPRPGASPQAASPCGRWRLSRGAGQGGRGRQGRSSRLGRGVLKADQAALMAGRLPRCGGFGGWRALALHHHLLLLVLHAGPRCLVLHALQPLVQRLQGQLPAGQNRVDSGVRDRQGAWYPLFPSPLTPCTAPWQGEQRPAPTGCPSWGHGRGGEAKQRHRGATCQAPSPRAVLRGRSRSGGERGKQRAGASPRDRAAAARAGGPGRGADSARLPLRHGGGEDTAAGTAPRCLTHPFPRTPRSAPAL